MSTINLAVKHNTTQAEARQRLESTTTDMCSRFGAIIDRTEWSADRNTVKFIGKGFDAEVWVDAESVHMKGNIPLLAGLLGSPMVKSLKGILEQNFQKRLS